MDLDYDSKKRFLNLSLFYPTLSQPKDQSQIVEDRYYLVKFRPQKFDKKPLLDLNFDKQTQNQV